MASQLSTPQDLLTFASTELGTSSWVEITQEHVNQFAEATGDHQWIHVDVQRAKAGAFGGTIAHGYLTLALAPRLMDEVLHIAKYDAVLNYGINKVRFPAPVPVGSRVRAVITLISAVERAGGTVEAIFGLRYEVEGGDRPPCVAETIYLYR
jgi:acyl dehydratase